MLEPDEDGIRQLGIPEDQSRQIVREAARIAAEHAHRARDPAECIQMWHKLQCLLFTCHAGFGLFKTLFEFTFRDWDAALGPPRGRRATVPPAAARGPERGRPARLSA